MMAKLKDGVAGGVVRGRTVGDLSLAHTSGDVDHHFDEHFVCWFGQRTPLRG